MVVVTFTLLQVTVGPGPGIVLPTLANAPAPWRLGVVYSDVRPDIQAFFAGVRCRSGHSSPDIPFRTAVKRMGTV